MKKLISAIAIATVATSTAFGAVTLEQRKTACMGSGKHIWDGQAQACIPKDPCRDKAYKDNGRYCNRVFGKVKLDADFRAEALVNAYVKKQLNQPSGCNAFIRVNTSGSANVLGDDTIGCVINGDEYNSNSNTMFVSFVFDSVNMKDSKQGISNKHKAMCEIIYGGRYYASSCSAPKTAGLTKEVCQEIFGWNDYLEGPFNKDINYVPEHEVLCIKNIS